MCTHPSNFVQNTMEHKELKNPAKDPQYSEPLVDAMRAQKDQVTHFFLFLQYISNSMFEAWVNLVWLLVVTCFQQMRVA